MTDDEGLHEEVRRLREEVETLHRRLDAVESAVDSGEPADTPPGSADEPPDPDTPGDSPTPDAPAEPSDPDTPAGPPASPGPAASAGATSAPAAGESRPEGGGSSTATDAGGSSRRATGSRDWELTVGVRWLGLAGALALVVGVVFFVRLAIERGLLGPAGRVAVGTAGGLLLFGFGRYAADHQGFVRWGRIAAGAGLAVAYFSVYAAYGFESYREAIGTPLWAVLGALTLLVAATAALSVRDGAPLVAGEAYLLGYATAYLSTDAATAVVTPVYALLLAAAVVTVATVKPWRGLAAASAVATYAVLGLWVVVVDPPRAAVAAAALAAFLTYLGGSYALHGGDREGRSHRVRLVSLTLSNAVAAGVLVEGSLQEAFAADVEGVGLAAVAAGLVGVYAATDRRRSHSDHVAGAASVPFAAAAVQVATDPFWTTVGWVALLLVAVAAARRADAPAVRFGAHGLAAALTVKVFIIDSVTLSPFEPSAPVAALSGRPVAFVLAVAALYGLAWRFDAVEPALTDHERSKHVSVDAGYAVAATVLVLTLLGVELSGLGASVAWALFGLSLLGVGLAVDRRGVRALGVGVLGVTTAKVFLYDTNDLDILARTLSFLVVGAILLVASYVYARSRGDERGLDLSGRG